MRQFAIQKWVTEILNNRRIIRKFTFYATDKWYNDCNRFLFSFGFSLCGRDIRYLGPHVNWSKFFLKFSKIFKNFLNSLPVFSKFSHHLRLTEKISNYLNVFTNFSEISFRCLRILISSNFPHKISVKLSKVFSLLIKFFENFIKTFQRRPSQPQHTR